jgi:putative hydrolase of the HAD superfamily
MRYIVDFLLFSVLAGSLSAIDAHALFQESYHRWICPYPFVYEQVPMKYTHLSEEVNIYRNIYSKESVNGILRKSKRNQHHRPVIVFDFGGVVGGTDKMLVAKALAPILDISVTDVLTLLTQIRVAKELGMSQERFWKEYEAASGKQLPDNWEEHYEEIRRLSIRAKPEMLKYVDCLRQHGYHVAMLSNTTELRAECIREKGFYRHFEPVVLSCDIGVKKPHQEAFFCLLNQLGASASDCIMIDNKPENIEAARRLGIDGIVFTSIHELRIELEKRGIHS